MNNAPKDGTFIATFFPSVLDRPLPTLGPRPIDPSKFGYVGNAKIEASVCMVRKDAGFNKIEDLRTRELTSGGTSGGSQVVDFPMVEKNLLGVKFKLIPGYQGTREVGAVIERGEVQGICGIGWSTLKVQYPDLPANNAFATIFAQEDVNGDPELNAAGVPLVYALARTDAERQVLQVLYAQNDLARPYAAPPGVAADRLDILRRGFMAALESEDLKADAAKMRVDVNATSGADMKAKVDAVYATAPEVLESLKRGLERANQPQRRSNSLDKLGALDQIGLYRILNDAEDGDAATCNIPKYNALFDWKIIYTNTCTNTSPSLKWIPPPSRYRILVATAM